MDEYCRKTKDLVLWRHCRLDHVSEAVALGNAKVGTIINTKKGWNYVQLQKVVIDKEFFGMRLYSPYHLVGRWYRPPRDDPD